MYIDLSFRLLPGNAPRKQGKARKISIVWILSGEEDGGSNSVAEDTDDGEYIIFGNRTTEAKL